MLDSFEARDAAALCGAVAPLLVPFSSSSSSRSFRFFLPFLVGVPFGFAAAASSTSSMPSASPTNGRDGGRPLLSGAISTTGSSMSSSSSSAMTRAYFLLPFFRPLFGLVPLGELPAEPLQHSPSLGANRSELPFFRRPEEVGFLAGWDGLVGRGAAIAQSSMSIVERVDVRARDTARRRAMQSGCGGRSAVCQGFRPLLGVIMWADVRPSRAPNELGRALDGKTATQTHSDGIQTLAPHTFSRRTTTLSLSRPSSSSRLRAPPHPIHSERLPPSRPSRLHPRLLPLARLEALILPHRHTLGAVQAT